MDAGAVAAISPSVGSASPRFDAVPPAARAVAESVGVRFDAVLAQEQTSPVGRPASAGSVDELIGTTVSPPPGGCMCDAMAASMSAPSTAGPADRPAARPTAAVQVSPFSVQVGDVLSIDTGTAGERLHLAIVRSAFEMLTPGSDGVVRPVPIPWSQVRDARRVL